MTRTRVAVLISGSGSNLQALTDACAAEDFPAEIALVISNKAEAYGLTRAAEAGIPAQVINHRDYPDREAFDTALHETLTAHHIEIVCLAGFMRLLTPGFVKRWEGKMLNIHPSLLPAFKGLHTHERVLEAGCRFTGCTVHFVVPEMDAGPVILQSAVPVHADDTPETLRTRVLETEHHCYPEALRLLVAGKLSIEEGRVRIEASAAPTESLVNPVLGDG